MNNPGEIPSIETNAVYKIEVKKQKGDKREEKEEKKDLTLDKLELALYRAQMAMVRTAVTTTSLGFALYKLLEEKANDGVKRPMLEVFTPRIISLILFITGFLGLISFSYRHMASLRKIGRLTSKSYYSGVMLMSYIILILTLFLFIGTLING